MRLRELFTRRERDGARARLRAALAAAALAACAFAQAAAQTAGDRLPFDFGPDFPRPWHLPEGTTKEEAAALGARWKAIGEELKTTASEFAGTYHEGGEMRQSYLRWAPRGGFVFLYVYEHFAVLDFSYGRAEVTPTAVVFTVEREQREVMGGASTRFAPRSAPSRWVAARWRLLNYLVPEEEVADFGRYVGGFGQYNEFNGPCCEFTPFFWARARRAPATSFDVPVTPAPYARLMRRPVEATLRFVGRKRVVREYKMQGELYWQHFERASLTPVRLDAGRRAGLRPGLLMRLVGAPGGQYLKVTRVGPASSEGVVVRGIDDDGRETFYEHDPGHPGPQLKVFPPVRVGARVTTAPPPHEL